MEDNAFSNNNRTFANNSRRTALSDVLKLNILSTEVEDAQWTAKTKERQLIRERGSLLKEVRELQHSTSTFNKAKNVEDRKHFNELQQKIGILSKLHHGSYQQNKLNTVNRIDSKRKNLKLLNEEGRKREMALTTTELRYQEIVTAMDQLMVEAEQLGLEFEKKLRDKARHHHELGLQLSEVGAQLRLEKDKKQKFMKDEERRKREEAMERLSQWRQSELMTHQLKSQLTGHANQYCAKSGRAGRKKRDMDHDVSLKRREYGRKLQDVNCLLKKVGEEQRGLAETRVHLDNLGTIASNERNVQEHISKQHEHLAQRQTKANKWEPKLRALARENEQRLEVMEKHVLYEDVAKAGTTERSLFRNMKRLEGEARKQEQVCRNKRQLMENETTNARKEAQDQLRLIDSTQNEMSQSVAREEGLLRQLIVQRDNALTDYRQHQTNLKEIIQLFQTLSNEQDRKLKVTES